MALTKISTGGVKDDAASQAIIADEAVDEARLQVSNAGSNGQFLSKQSGNTGGLTWATVTVPDSDKIEEGNTSVETVDTGSDGHVKISTEGTERVRVTNDGKVGITTTTPTELVDLGGGNKLNLKVGLRGYIGQGHSSGATIVGHCVKADTTNTVSGQMMVTETNSGGGAPSAIRQESGVIQFHTAGSGTADAVFNSERMRLGSAGQLGIAGANYGTSGQVLTSGGASAAPSWATPSSGAWSKLTSGTFSSSDGSGNSVSKTITTTHLTSTHKLYKLSMLFSMSSTSWNTGLQVQSGGQWQASNYQYVLHGVKSVSHNNSNRGSQNRIHFGDDNWYSKVYNVEIFFGDVDSSNGRRYFKLSGLSNNSTNGFDDQSTWNMFAAWDYAAAITGVRVFAEQSGGGSGNFDHGWYVLEGCAI